MKIGILTFHRAENFGAVLQAFALQTFLQILGHDVQVIDYRCKSIDEQYHIFNPSILFKRRNFFASLKIYLSRIKHFRLRLQKKKLYGKFRQQFLNLSSPVTSKSILKYDAYITGSDQVWNPYLTGGCDDFYFLNKSFMDHSKKISYAASCEGYNYQFYSSNRQNVLELFNRFDRISVREKMFADILKPLVKQNIFVNIDPTFLLPSDEYLKIAAKPKEKNYILVYHLVECQESSNIAKSLAKNGQKVIEIHAGYIGPHKRNHYYSLGPTELLGYIAYADAVVTTSFHGLALSLIFHKNIVVVDARNNARLKSLLHSFNLDGLLVSQKNQLPIHKIDYDKYDAMIEIEKKKTMSYLRDALLV